jgi:glycine/D-amino acid oxidase-like deaminating enzyme
VSGLTPASVIVLGGGLAGLTAAHRLVSHGTRVTLLDQRSTLGGSAISSGQGQESSPLTISNSHQATWALWRSLPSQVSSPPLVHVPLEFLLPNGRTIAYPFTPLPRPMHIGASLLRFHALTWRERWRLVSWLEQIWEEALQLPSDFTRLTADEWLAALGQGDQARRIVWNPLAQWLTGNELRELSADVFRRAIEPIFLRSARETRWAIIPSLRASLVQPMIDKLRTRDATVLLDTEATQVLSEGDRVIGVLLRNGSILRGDWYLAALPPRRLAMLLPERWLSRYAYFQQLAELVDLPTISAQIIIVRSLAKPRILLLSRGCFHSMVALPIGSGRTVCRFSGGDETAVPPMTSERSQAAAEEVLRSVHLLSPGHTLVSCDYQRNEEGRLSLAPEVQPRRPLQRSPIANLLVAGAWTDTGWPPSVESAIVSADRCVEKITDSLS